jgi:hypothetical protein
LGNQRAAGLFFRFGSVALHISKSRSFKMTLEETRAALKQLRIDAERIERALHKHAAVERDPALHGKLFWPARRDSRLRPRL